jgi:hypothetical protein
MDVDAREGRIDGDGNGDGDGDGARGEQSSQMGIESISANCKHQAPVLTRNARPRVRATKGGCCG